MVAKKVLIVDDDEQLLLILKESLGKYKNLFTIHAVKNGIEAIRALQKEKIDMVVTDIAMPRVNGYVLLSYIHKNFPETPCVIMSSQGTPELQEKLKQKTALFLKKPFSIDELADFIITKLDLEPNVLGTMNGVSIKGFLKMVESDSMTCLCKVQGQNDKTGYMIFEGGELYNAFYDKMQGQNAVMELFKLDSVKIIFKKPPKKKFPRKIKCSIEHLLQKASD